MNHNGANAERFGLSDEELFRLADGRTPLYVYDLARVKRRVTEFKEALRSANAALFFATMANDRPRVLEVLADQGVGACVNSERHLALAIRAGFVRTRIQFTSTGMTQADMKLLQRLQIRANIDSLQQLETWMSIGGKEAGIRINAASLNQRLPADRIGIDAGELRSAEMLAKRFGGKVSGLHVYTGTNFQDPKQMLPTLAAFFDLAATVTTISYVNIGGGIGVNYRHQGSEFDLRRFGEGVGVFAQRLRERTRRDIEVIVEPGRSLVAVCGLFLTRVTDVKSLGGQAFASVDASIAVFPRPLHHPETPHQIRYLKSGNSKRKTQERDTLVVGRTTFSRDILGRTQLPHDIRPGDILGIYDAGAYCTSMASRFLGQREPSQVFLDVVRDRSRLLERSANTTREHFHNGRSNRCLRP
jgi:diaminopimelate decarboxylase